MKKNFFIGIVVSLTVLLLPRAVNGQVMSNDNFSVEKKDIEIGKFRPLSTPTPAPQIEKHFTSGQNYTVDTTNASSFSFAVSHEFIDFGKLTATNPVIRLLYLTITNSKPYHILASENHPLSDGAKSIPDSTCDNGSCSEEVDANWTSALTYGFGYQLTTMPETNFRHLPNWSQNEGLAEIASGEKAQNTKTEVNFKVNIPATQQAGQYKNVVTFIASPAF